MTLLAPIAEELKAARKTKKLSQQDLAQKVCVPQSHISKIESGKVDLKTSSLIELARALELEVMLVPRALVPALDSMKRGAGRPSSEPIPAYRLDDEDSDG